MLHWLTLTLLPPLGAFLIRVLGRLVAIETRGGEQVDELSRRGTRIIIAFWHGRQLMMPLAYRGDRAHILISQHRDGELIHRIVSRFGFRSVRGSSTRGGPSALRQLIRLGRSGADLVVTPDGPKGPRQVVQMGVVQLAKATGLPVVPLTFSCTKKNCSRAGIAFSCPTQRGGASSSGARRSGWRAMPTSSAWRPGDGSLRRHSTRSPKKRMTP